MGVELKDTRGETVIVILLNGHSIKVTSKFISMAKFVQLSDLIRDILFCTMDRILLNIETHS